MVADLEVGDVGAEGLDHACRLMPQGHGQGAGAVAVDDAEVRMAQARRLDGHQDLARTGIVEGDGLDAERAAVGIGAGGTPVAQDGGAGGGRHGQGSHLLAG